MKILTTNNGMGAHSEALYDWTRTKSALVTDWCNKTPWMALCEVKELGKPATSMRFYFQTQAEAQVLAARWLTCVHDRTPQPKFNAWGAQCGWWKTDELGRIQAQVKARAQALEDATEAAEGPQDDTGLEDATEAAEGPQDDTGL